MGTLFGGATIPDLAAHPDDKPLSRRRRMHRMCRAGLFRKGSTIGPRRVAQHMDEVALRQPIQAERCGFDRLLAVHAAFPNCLQRDGLRSSGVAAPKRASPAMTPSRSRPSKQ